MFIILMLGIVYALTITGFQPRLPITTLKLSQPTTTHIYEELC